LRADIFMTPCRDRERLRERPRGKQRREMDPGSDFTPSLAGLSTEARHQDGRDRARQAPGTTEFNGRRQDAGRT